MKVLIVVVVVVLVAIFVAARVVRRRSFESVAMGAPGMHMSQERSTLEAIPTPEEATREAVARNQEYDAEDDQLDPHHGEHRDEPEAP